MCSNDKINFDGYNVIAGQNGRHYSIKFELIKTKRFMSVDVFVTSECIHLCILCIVTRCLFQDVSIMYLSHFVMPGCFDREDQ